jgi:Ca2+:H+ antiporter
MDTSHPRLRKSTKPGPEDMTTLLENEALSGQERDIQRENGDQEPAAELRTSSNADSKRAEVLGNSVLRVLKSILGCSYANLLLPFVFLGITAGSQGWDDSIIFLFNFLAILSLAALLSFATEELAKSVGQTVGGLINATFGNAVEMIVSIPSFGLVSCEEANNVGPCAGGDYGCPAGGNKYRPI